MRLMASTKAVERPVRRTVRTSGSLDNSSHAVTSVSFQ